MKIDMRKEILSVIESDEKKRMIQFKLTSIKVLKQMSIVKIEEEFDEKEALQIIIDEEVENDLKERR
jgi:hypothetical protein